MGGIKYVYWPDTTTRLTPWMLYCLQRLDADLQKLFGVSLSLDSSDTQRGIRTHEEQTNLFLSRYRVQWDGKGPFGDVRYWQGRRYVRHSGLGTVAQPGTSNHEIQDNYYAAIDLADSGGAGIGTMGSARSNWLRDNAWRYGLEPEGFKFKEAWHYRVPGIFQEPPVPPAPPIQSEEDDMRLSTWNGAVWLVAPAFVSYIPNLEALSAAKKLTGQPEAKDYSNDEFTQLAFMLAIPWAAFDATFKGKAFDNESKWGSGQHWDRQMAEGREDLLRDEALAKNIDQLIKSTTKK